MALKIAVNNKIELFLQKQAQDTKKSLGWKKKSALYLFIIHSPQKDTMPYCEKPRHLLFRMSWPHLGSKTHNCLDLKEHFHPLNACFSNK